MINGKILACGVVVYLLLATCWSANSAGNPPPETPRFSHPREITNPYLPLASLKQDILESGSERIERTVRPERRRTFQIHHQTVEALTVEDREFKHGQLAEVAFDYVAQADDGTVYYLGEDVDEYRDGKVASHSGAWLFGKDTPRMGVLMPAHPQVGGKFRSEDVPKITWENDEVVEVAETVTVPAGSYKDCVKIREELSDGSTEYKLYAPSVGTIKEIESDGGLAEVAYYYRGGAVNTAGARRLAPILSGFGQPSATGLLLGFRLERFPAAMGAPLSLELA